jgi:putative transcriptional regulator
MDNMAIYNRLKILIAEKEFREKRKLTYRTIAKETGISTSTLTKYMGQEVKSFDTATLETLCNYFGIQPGDLLIHSQEPPAVNS